MQDQAPIVGRPRGNAWRVLQADGIEWEGQVYLIGDEIDLAMRLIVTRKRIAFARGGGIALEVDRVSLELLQRHELQRPFVGRGEHDRRGHTGVENSHTTSRPPGRVTRRISRRPCAGS